jgi:mannose-6-phosphate isomerase-like protein (cupin superfamily)
MKVYIDDMNAKIIRAKELKENVYDNGNTKVTNVVNTDQWPHFSLAVVKKLGDDIRYGYDKEANVAYYVLEGSGTCVIEGKRYRIKKGDCVLYPKGTKYKNLKGLKLLAISNPRFDRAKRVYVEKAKGY